MGNRSRGKRKDGGDRKWQKDAFRTEMGGDDDVNDYRQIYFIMA